MKMLIILDVDFFKILYQISIEMREKYGMLSRFFLKYQKSAIWRISHFRRRKVKLVRNTAKIGRLNCGLFPGRLYATRSS